MLDYTSRNSNSEKCSKCGYTGNSRGYDIPEIRAGYSAGSGNRSSGLGDYSGSSSNSYDVEGKM